MKKTIGIILNAESNASDLGDLLGHRSLSTLPFCGRYRLIDFTLSNMVNSGIDHIGVIGANKYASLIDHLGTGKEWDLSRKTQDLTILEGSSSVRFGDLVKINLRGLSDNKNFIEDEYFEDVIIAGSNIITTYDFTQPLKIHKNNKSDITMIFKKVQPFASHESNDVFLKFDKFRVTGMHFKDEAMTDYCYSDMMIVKKNTLLNLLDIGERLGEWDLMDIIRDNLNTLHVLGAPHTGYFSRITHLKDFYETNMDLLDYDVMKNVFLTEKPILTKVKDNHPTVYQNSSDIRNSIVASGCEIEGSVNHSVIFRESNIKAGTDIQNSIIMQKANIGENVKLNYVIFDKNVTISDNVSLIGKRDAPIVIGKGMVI